MVKIQMKASEIEMLHEVVRVALAKEIIRKRDAGHEFDSTVDRLDDLYKMLTKALQETI
jgi:hypothetical protein